MGRVDPVERAEMRSGEGSGRRHTSYVETPALVQLTWDTTHTEAGWKSNMTTLVVVVGLMGAIATTLNFLLNVYIHRDKF